MGPTAAHCERLIISSVAEKSLNIHFGYQELDRYCLVLSNESIICAASEAIPSLSAIFCRGSVLLPAEDGDN
jgi:hypothetical protein